MPWKVFTQSLALTNFGNKLANDQFIQRQKCLLLPKYSPKVGQFGLWTILLPSGDPFRGHTRKVGACWSKHTLRWLAKYALSLCGIWSCYFSYGRYIGTWLPRHCCISTFPRKGWIQLSCEPRSCPLALWWSISKSFFHLNSQQIFSIDLVWQVLPFGLLPLSCRWLARYAHPSCPNQIEKAFLVCHWRWTQCR